MLIDKGVTAGEVVTVKLINGDELLTRLVEEKDTHYTVSKPMLLTVNQQGIGMMPYMFTVDPDKDIKINRALVIVIANAEKTFANQYLEGTTGIKLA
jgi:hypothetical protein